MPQEFLAARNRNLYMEGKGLFDKESGRPYSLYEKQKIRLSKQDKFKGAFETKRI